MQKHVRLCAVAAIWLWQAGLSDARAAAVTPCDENSPTELDYLVDNRDYAEGAIRVFSVDTYGEPVCCSRHIIVYVGLKDELGAACFQLSASGDKDQAGRLGFYDVALRDAVASYNPGTGLSLRVPVSFFSEDGVGKPGSVAFTVDQAQTSVTLTKK